MVEQNQIQRLCEEMIKAEDDREVHRLCTELHTMIHEHIEALRRQVFKIPAAPGSFVIEKDKKAA